jgi:hypothetical protein
MPATRKRIAKTAPLKPALAAIFKDWQFTGVFSSLLYKKKR